MAQKDSYGSSDNLPLARVRDTLPEAEHPLPGPADQGHDMGIGPQPPDPTADMDKFRNESEERAEINITASKYGKRPHSSDSPTIESEAKRTQIFELKGKKERKSGREIK